jgi:hypothetical protein
VPAIEPTTNGPDDTVSFEQAVRMLSVSSEYLTELLDARAIHAEVVDGERSIRIGDLEAYRERRAGAQAALRTMGAITERPVGRSDS